MQEWIIAAQLERRYTKDEIIAMYFNRFDFVNNAVGIKSASSVYFDKAPSELTLEEIFSSKRIFMRIIYSFYIFCKFKVIKR